MQKQYSQISRVSHKHQRQSPSHTKCRYCAPLTQQLGLPLIVETLLTRKYSKLASDSTNASQFQQFVNGLSIKYRGGLSQFLIEYPVISQNLNSFYKISQIKQKITGLVKKSAGQFKPKIMHFYYPYFRFLLKALHCYSRLSPNFKKEYNRTPGNRIDLDVFNNSFINTKNIKKKQAHSQKKNRMKVKFRTLDESQNQIKILCKKIGIMCYKFRHQNQRSNKKFRESLESLAIRKSSQKNIQQKKFKANIQHNFSIIKLNEGKSRQKNKKSQCSIKQVDQIYGISEKKPKKKIQTSDKKQHLKSMNFHYDSKRASTQKIQFVQDSPVSQAYYTKQFNYTETAGPIKIKRKQKFHRSSHKLREKSKNSPCGKFSSKLYKSTSHNNLTKSNKQLHNKKVITFKRLEANK